MCTKLIRNDLIVIENVLSMKYRDYYELELILLWEYVCVVTHHEQLFQKLILNVSKIT